TSIYTYHTHCLAAVQWPGKYIWLDYSKRAQPPGNPDAWVGSLVKNKRDLTGNLYMRNRYYDPRAGRFSQEDPIGLAGGLNAYGFAAGDPVSYSDPYGLCPFCIVVGAIIVIEAASSLYDAYDAAKTASGWARGDVSDAAMGITMAGAIAGVFGPLGGYGRAGRELAGFVDPKTLRFTQDNIKESFQDGSGSVHALAEGLRSGAIDPASIPPIRLVEHNGAMYSLDNRRLAAFHLAGVNVPARMATPAEVAKEWTKKFTTQNGGSSIEIRGGGGTVP
ncbi:MAG TPA: RHS repeat-associated core domain-containing protein, partial [Longimicrobium sp.]|nr:RHS repeat-associated core domain-containing protein [Longimicrobium sp.]